MFSRAPGHPASAAGGRGRRPRGALPARARDRTRFPTLLPAALRAPMRAGPGTALSRTHPDLQRWEAGIAVYGVFAPRKAPQITVYFIIFAANRYISIRTMGVFVVLFGSSFPARAATAPTYSQVVDVQIGQHNTARPPQCRTIGPPRIASTTLTLRLTGKHHVLKASRSDRKASRSSGDEMPCEMPYASARGHQSVQRGLNQSYR